MTEATERLEAAAARSDPTGIPVALRWIEAATAGLVAGWAAWGAVRVAMLLGAEWFRIDLETRLWRLGLDAAPKLALGAAAVYFGARAAPARFTAIRAAAAEARARDVRRPPGATPAPRAPEGRTPSRVPRVPAALAEALRFRFIPLGEAVGRLFDHRRRGWFNTILFLYIVWLFFLPSLWHMGLFLAAGVWCGAVTPCFMGPSATGVHGWTMLVAQVVASYLVLWYTAYVFAYLREPGAPNRVLGLLGLLGFPVLVLWTFDVLRTIGSLARVPSDELQAFLHRMAPFTAWVRVW